MITKAQSKHLTGERSSAPRPRLTALERGLLRWTMAEAGDKVLDASVGNGMMLEYLQRHRNCEACGMSDEMECVRDTRSLIRNADIVYASLEDIPWKENSFDSVYIKALEGMPSERGLHEIMRVLKPGGQLLIGTKWLPAPVQRILSFLRGDGEETYSRREGLSQRLIEEGFLQVTWQPVGGTNAVSIGWKPIEVE